MPITLKKYECPTCGQESNHSTNHYGEIYSGCKNCGASVLYCVESEGYAERESMTQNWVHIYFYRFDIGEECQKQAYKALKKTLESQGRKAFKSYCTYKYMEELKSGAVLFKVYNKDTFENQYITDKGRLFNWFEEVVPNKDIKVGYYLYIQD